MLPIELESAIAAYVEGRITLDELRSEILTHLDAEDPESIFEALPEDATAGLLDWLNTHPTESSPPVTLSTLGAGAPETGAASRVVASLKIHTSSVATWINDLDLERAAHNVKIDTFGDWVRDPWGWPELKFYATSGRKHLVARALRGPIGDGAVFDVPKSATETRPAILLDLIERLLYQACADQATPKVNQVLPDWVYGWRLPARRSRPGYYARNDYQWASYISRLKRDAYQQNSCFRADVESFFSKLSFETIAAAVRRVSDGRAADMILGIVAAGERATGRTGLPQRSTASCVIANAILAPLDNVIASFLPQEMPLAVRWVDDIWIFADTAALAGAESVVAEQLASVGLSLNVAKSGPVEGIALDRAIDRLDMAYIDFSLTREFPDYGPLADALEEILANPERATRHEIMFVTSKIKQRRRRELAEALANAPLRLPHGGDLLAGMFKKLGIWRDLRDWYGELVADPAADSWAKASFLRMFPLDEPATSRTVDSLYDLAMSSEEPSYLRVAALSRVIRWRPDVVRDATTILGKRDLDVFMRRAVGIAAASSGCPRPAVRRILLADQASAGTADFLEFVEYAPAAFGVVV